MLETISLKGGGGVTREELDDVMKTRDQGPVDEICFDDFADW